MAAEVLAEFLEEPHVGVIATLRRDGHPYTVPVWWLWKEPYIWLTGTYSRVWCKQDDARSPYLTLHRSDGSRERAR
jgi:hypothetical protein